MTKRLQRPGGHAPPEHVTAQGTRIALAPIAVAVTDRFLERHPDELERYENAELVREWCQNDTRHLIGWAAAEAERGSPLAKQLDWLGVVLESRGYPVQRLADTLEISAEVLHEKLGAQANDIRASLTAGAAHVRSKATFLVPAGG
jgi:hypothetical protein